jgi:hypothetical protein
MPSRPRDPSFNYFYEEGVELIFGLVGSVFLRSIFVSIFTLCVFCRGAPNSEERLYELHRTHMRVVLSEHTAPILPVNERVTRVNSTNIINI